MNTFDKSSASSSLSSIDPFRSSIEVALFFVFLEDLDFLGGEGELSRPASLGRSNFAVGDDDFSGVESRSGIENPLPV